MCTKFCWSIVWVTLSNSQPFFLWLSSCVVIWWESYHHILFIVILTIALSISLPLISKVRVFLLPTCVSNLSSFQSQTDGRHNFAKEGKRRKKESSWKEQLLLLTYYYYFRIINRKKTFYTLQRSALFKDDPVPRQGPTMATIDGRGKYKIPRNIFTSILAMKIFSLILLHTILGQSEPDMFSEVCPPPSTIPTFTKCSTVWINHFPQNWR